LRRAVRPARRVPGAATGGDADGVRRPDGGDEPVQQCVEGRSRRVPLAVPQGGPMSGLAGRGALVTGAAHGQGRAAALALAREGAHVAALDVAKPLAYPGYGMGTSAELESLAAECRALGVTALPFAADVRDDAAVSRAVEETVKQLGRVDVLFN